MPVIEQHGPPPGFFEATKIEKRRGAEHTRPPLQEPANRTAADSLSINHSN